MLPNTDISDITPIFMLCQVTQLPFPWNGINHNSTFESSFALKMFLWNFCRKPEYFGESSKDVFAGNFSNFFFLFAQSPYFCFPQEMMIEKALKQRHFNMKKNLLFRKIELWLVAGFWIQMPTTAALRMVTRLSK